MMLGRWIESDEEADDFMASREPHLKLRLMKKRDGWVAVIDGTDTRPLPHYPMHKRKLQITLAGRYLAFVYDDTAYVNLQWARGMPNWATKLGALPELAAAILKCEEVANG